MSTNGPTNGAPSNRVLWWLIGGILTPLIITAFNTITGDSKRVAALETVFQEMSRRLERMEGKIERLLERKQ
jgi:hypothetical protein